MNLLEVETFETTFGPKKQRKKPKLNFVDIDSFASVADESNGTFFFFKYI